METLYLDIETLPAPKEIREMLEEYHRKRIEKGKTEKTFEEFLESTGFDGAFGRIFCISFAVNNEAVNCLCSGEKQMIEEFWKIAKNINLFVGFNILDFDLRFIYQRSIVNNIRPSLELPFARYRNYPIFDIMYEWSKWGTNRINLDGLARALGIPSPKDEGIDGSMVKKFYEMGKTDEICKYCNRDVLTTREIYKRMTFNG